VTDAPRPPIEAWIVGAKVRVKVSYSWLRENFSSWAAPVYTSYSGGILELVAAPQFDGIQWWWQVKVPNTGIIGWVEQKSLELPPANG
jgi:hypothetical protein